MTYPSASRSSQDSLRGRLRHDARAARTDFSPDLHRRIMHTLRERGLASAEHPAARLPAWRRALLIGLPVAAAFALASWTYLHSQKQPEPPPQHFVRLPDMIPDELLTPVREAIAPSASSWDDGKFGYLDRDARRLALFVADQIPGLPAPR